jgi:hypothetical protein
MVITEYGIADIRGRTDQEIDKAMLNVADSRLWDELRVEAKHHRKIAAGYRTPPECPENALPQLPGMLRGFKVHAMFAPFPFGPQATRDERVLDPASKVPKGQVGQRHGEGRDRRHAGPSRRACGQRAAAAASQGPGPGDHARGGNAGQDRAAALRLAGVI